MITTINEFKQFINETTDREDLERRERFLYLRLKANMAPNPEKDKKELEELSNRLFDLDTLDFKKNNQ
jgi:hypothetical protein